MAGIYIHIPFCKQRCLYCDFYTEVAPQYVDDIVDAIVQEIEIRKDYLPSGNIQTVYFGGGTPSVLSERHFQQIFHQINSLYAVDTSAEITLEANPDDLNPAYVEMLKRVGFNRISIGIQSFEDKDLKLIHRRHSARQAIQAVKNAQQAGFDNISVDLIYGLPNQTINEWSCNIDTAFSLDIQHLSAYGLTYEEGTKLTQLLEKGAIQEQPDETMNEMYLLLLDKVEKQGFEAYEISNFCLPGYRSRHNSAYWKSVPYIGLGPAAHSYDGNNRQWNVSSIGGYIDGIKNNNGFFELETLTDNDRYNDYIMVGLRTSEGINIGYIHTEFGKEFADYCLENIKTFTKNKKICKNKANYHLTISGIMISNHIISSLMKV